MPGELRGDFTRDTFDRRKHFLRVLIQQGRVSIDADWNEQASILVHLQRSLARDVFGDHGASPLGLRGFEIEVLSTGPQAAPVAVPDDFRISGGRYYVQGTLCEVEIPSVLVVQPPTPPPAPALPQPAANRERIWVSTATLDGRALDAGDYVEVFDAATTANVVVARITTRHHPHHAHVLDLDTLLTSLTTRPWRLRRVTTYRTQPDYRLDTPALEETRAGRQTVVYLDVWERHLTSIQDGEIREVALGTADTATRSKVVWQVKVTDLAATVQPKADYDGFVRALRERLDRDERPGGLKARTTPDAPASDPCTVSPDARYRGVENQLYRVEVHRGGAADPNPLNNGASFKWSRENGSVVFPIRSGGGTNLLTLEHIGHDDRSALREGDWVEVVDDAIALRNHDQPLLEVKEIDRVAMTALLSGNALVGQHPGTHQILVRWDRNPEAGLQIASDDAHLIVEGSGAQHWLPLEDGIEIQFQEPAPGSGQGPAHYRTGDYWLIPARTATGDIEWPVELDTAGRPWTTPAGAVIPIAQGPHGVEHRYAPVAVITIDANGALTAVTDQRLTSNVAMA